jgi:hypothetical protein
MGVSPHLEVDQVLQYNNSLRQALFVPAAKIVGYDRVHPKIIPNQYPVTVGAVFSWALQAPFSQLSLILVWLQVS